MHSSRFTLLATLALVFSFSAGSSSAAGEPDSVRVAAVQISGYDKGDRRRTGLDPTTSMLPYIDKAAAEGAQLVVFPEYLLGRITVPGPTTEKLAEAARRHRVYVIAGCWELFGDGTYANTALIFDRDGKIAGKYRKTHAAVDHFEGEPAWSRPPGDKDRAWFLENDPEWTMQRGDELPVFELDFGKVAVLTCYDGWFPEPFRVLSLGGAEIIVWINGRRGSVEDFIVRSAMFQNHVAVITANQAYGSGTMIGDVPSRILKRCPDRTESYIVDDIDLRRIRNLRKRSRNFRQRRPDLYSRIVRNTTRVAAISFEPTKFDLAANADTLEQMFRDAAAGGAKIAVAPEGALDGYVVNQIISQAVSAEKMRDVAISLDSPTMNRFADLARELRMCLVFGFAEAVGEDVFNSAVFIDHEGNIRGKHQKMQLAEGYDPSWWFNRMGAATRAFDTPYGRCGVMICNDRWNPSLAKIPALDGAQFLVIPSFGSASEAQDEAVLSRSRETGLPIIEANVGVTLVADDSEIAAVERRKTKITFSEIEIPLTTRIDAKSRDAEEEAFLQWRAEEMPRRLQATREHYERLKEEAEK